ncbi:RagB/SusD family nutrient uptake outer membrane protein [Geofilum sp. OHC36d9]|uniref:RagB/SusD family nutrient uptake outer membrane protein n=1 Tax=Geofilum sp. OHC36d9 TaxID=3458413 RepID=UPI0040337CD2
MNKKYIYALLAPAFFAFAGCDDNLDTLPDGDIVTTGQKEEVVASDPSKAAAGVNAVFALFSQYMPNKDALNAERHNDFGYPSVMMFTDGNGYDVVSEDNGYNWSGNNLDFTDRSATSRESQILWNDMYSIIKGANNVIGAVDPLSEDAVLKSYLGQSLATRAFSYWVLAQLFQYTYVGNEDAPCVPVVTDKNFETAAVEGLPRETVKNVYDFIISDLNDAIDLLIVSKEAGIKRADKRYIDLSVAYGLRARVNLTMQKWAEAAVDADSAISVSDAKPSSIEEASKPAFWTVNETNWMWGIIIEETDEVVTSGIVNWISHMGSLNYGYANYSKGRQINKALFNTISSSDARKGWWLDEAVTSPNIDEEMAEYVEAKGYAPYTQVKFAPYKNEVATATNANDIPLMRIEEMYLIKAEALAMSGGDGKGTLEAFIKSSRDPDYVCSVSSPEDVQQEVFRHRRIELWGEGLNWFDVMRLKTGVDRRGGGYPNASMIFNISATDPILLWRIPEAEIEANQMLSNTDNNPAGSTPEPVADL